jgi:nitroreductase
VSNLRSFHDVVRDRRSVRSFLPTPVPEETIRSVLEEAQCAPSNCNTQPWQAHIASGGARERLSAAIVAAQEAGRFSPDFSFSVDDYCDVYRARATAQGAGYYQAIGISREAYEDRKVAGPLNLTFFNAPHVAMLFMNPVGDNVRVASDIGMYAQTFLLSLTAHGLAGIPQTSLGFYADTIREALGIDPALKLLFGVSFGHPDASHPGSRYRIGKAPIEDSVTFHR